MLKDIEKDKDADKLKEHVRILQEENFRRFSQIADLQVEVNNLKVQLCHTNTLHDYTIFYCF